MKLAPPVPLLRSIVPPAIQLPQIVRSPAAVSVRLPAVVMPP